MPDLEGPRKQPEHPHYEILEPCGRGGMGVVYKARDRRLNRFVALKFLTAAHAGQPDSLRRFRREAESIAALNHPNVATLYEIGEWMGEPFLALEFLPGGTLRDRVKGRVLDLHELLTYVRQIGAGLAYAHECGICHRDIKPSNIMFSSAGHAKLVDFGLAKGSDSEDLTRPDAPLGTTAYMAPEVMEGAGADALSDQYSLGVLIYELAAGRAPFRGETVQAIVHRVMMGEAEPLGVIRPDLPPEFIRCVELAMHRDRRRRFESVSALLEALDRLEPGSHTGSRGARTPEPAGLTETLVDNRDSVVSQTARQVVRRRRLIWGGAALLAAVCAVTVFRWLPSWTGGAGQPPKVAAVRTLVVLPFENLASDAAQQSLCAGLQETVTGLLSQWQGGQGGLLVVAASEVRRSQVNTIADARKMFNASHALTGSVQKNGDRLQVTLNLAEAATLRQVDSRSLILGKGEADDLPRQLSQELARLVSGVGGLTARTAEATRDATAYALYLRGQGELQSQGTEAAIALFRQALERDPGFQLARVGLAEAYLARHRESRDPKWLAMADAEGSEAARHGSSTRVQYVQALIRKGTGDYERAIDLLRKVLAQEPGNVEALRQMADALNSAGRPEEAEKTCRDAIRMQPGYWPLHNTLGVFYYRRKQLDQAERAWLTALSLAPENPVLRANMGALYYQQGRLDEAAREMETSIRLRPNALGFSNLGTTKFFRGDFAGAVAAFQKAVELQPGNALNWGNLGDAQAQASGQVAKARESYAKAALIASEQLALNPTNVPLRKSFSLYQCKLGKREEARRDIEAALAKSGNNAEVRFYAARVFTQLGDTARGMKELEQCVRLGHPWHEIRGEPDLAALRGLAAYRTLESTRK